MPTQEEIKNEDKKIRHLRRMVDFTISLIATDHEMTLQEASGHIASLRDFALNLFPDKGEVFDLVYAPKLKRLIVEKFMLC
ncbi:MAG: hypothetical protein HY891_03900 [Deltaproteobacteria bacterium]|nr:hypothetical protein [Deltaproteobacteria bacterium]